MYLAIQQGNQIKVAQNKLLRQLRAVLPLVGQTFTIGYLFKQRESERETEDLSDEELRKKADGSAGRPKATSTVGTS